MIYGFFFHSGLSIHQLFLWVLEVILSFYLPAISKQESVSCLPNRGNREIINGIVIRSPRLLRFFDNSSSLISNFQVHPKNQ